MTSPPVDLLQLRIIWDRQVIPLPHKDLNFHQLHVGPEPGHPFGRKGLAIASAWRDLANPATAGVLLLDGDVAIDPHDLRLMHAAINCHPADVSTAWAKIWPMSTKGDSWWWSHMTGFPERDRQSSRGETDPGYRFSFCFTYLPRSLMERAIRSAGMKTWAYPVCDMRMHELAASAGYTVRAVPGLHVKHLNY